MENQGRKIGHIFWYAILAIILIAVGTYAVISYAIPYLEWRAVEKRIESIRKLPECKEDDEECMQRNWQEANKLMGQNFQAMAPSYEVLKMNDVIEKMKHYDGTVCYMVDAPVREVSDEDLAAWLKEFGVQKFYDQAHFFLWSRGVFEEKYHKPTPFGALISAVARLKWKHFPFGKTWRTYNSAQRFDIWAYRPEEKKDVPDDIKNEILPILTRHGEYFTNRNFFRLLDMSKAELGIGN